MYRSGGRVVQIRLWETALRLLSLAALSVVFMVMPADAQAKGCDGNAGLGVARVLELDVSKGGRFGKAQFEATLPLEAGEVVLTFDDGPLPHVTNKILKALKQHCAKATFFAVGKMAKAAPEVMKRIASEGHSIGTHTHSHPRDLRHHYNSYSRYQIERGFYEVAASTGQPISAFFRYPGLHDEPKLNDYLSSREIVNLSVDIIPGDTDGLGPARLISRTLSQLKRRGKGIILLHDIKPATAKALPGLLTALKARGYKLVHIVSSKPYQPVPIALLHHKYGALSHKNPKTIIGGKTYRQLYSEVDRKIRARQARLHKYQRRYNHKTRARAKERRRRLYSLGKRRNYLRSSQRQAGQ